MNDKVLEVAGVLRKELVSRLKLDVNPEEIAYNEQLFDGGLELDSIDVLEIVSMIKNIYGVEVTMEDKDNFQNLELLSKVVVDRL